MDKNQQSADEIYASKHPNKQTTRQTPRIQTSKFVKSPSSCSWPIQVHNFWKYHPSKHPRIHSPHFRATVRLCTSLIFFLRVQTTHTNWLLGQISTSELNSHSTQTHKQTNLDCVDTSSRGLTALHPHWLPGQISTSEWDSHSTHTRNQTKLDCVGTSSRGLIVYNLAKSTETNELVPHNLSLFAP